MMGKAGESQSSSPWQRMIQGSMVWFFVVVVTLGMTLILSFNLTARSDVSVVLGQPAPNDVFAPRSVNYTSALLTEQAQEQARDSVEEVYTPLDLSIGRAQKSRARAVFAFVEVVRADSQATKETKVAYLMATEGLTVEEQVALGLVELSSTDYETAKANVLIIIEELMRQEIRAANLRDYQRAARREASLELTPTQEIVVTSLAPQFIVPTIFPDQATTAQRRDEAVAAVAPVVRSITKDLRVIGAGDVITEADIEMLQELGLMQQEPDFRDFSSIFMVSLVSVVLITMYWHQFHSVLREGIRYLAALAVVILVFTLGAKLMTAGSPLLAYWYPTAAMSMLVAVIYDVRLAMMVTVVMSAMLGYVGGNSLELASYSTAGGVLALLTLRNARARRINAFFRAGLVAAVGHVFVVLIFQLPQNLEIVDLLQFVLFGLANGILSAALTLLGFFAMGSLFGLTTTLQLQELSRLDHPLLQELLRRAPGTYHHSIMVANLAEQAAERIQANATLVRVGAFYHDIGKMNRPPFFTENQEGYNPHDTMDPASSARIILSHVTDGLELAKRYRLPDRIRDFIAEHHGDKLTKVFYARALEQAGEDADEVDIVRFRHRGPRPRSRETGIVLLADTIDAASSAIRPNSEKEIERLVNSIIDDDLTDGQLDDSGLTLGDIKVVRASFIETLKGRYHVRVKYPGNEAMMADEGRAAPVPPPIVSQPVAEAAEVAEVAEVAETPATPQLSQESPG